MVVTQTASSPKPTDPRKSPWPEIRKARIQKLLPQAMQLAGIDAWVVICRHNNDPLALYVGGRRMQGARGYTNEEIGMRLLKTEIP